MTEVSFRDSEDECVTYGYDPSWTLPFAARARTDALEPREAIAWGLVSLAAAALSSRDENTRKIACAILATVDERVRDPLVSFRERGKSRVSERHAQRRDDAGDSVVFPERDARRRVSDVVPVSRDGDVPAASETIE